MAPTIDNFLVQLFWTRVTKTESCWLYNRASKNGYARISVLGYVTQAHQLSWMIANDRFIPKGMVIRHSCDNPTCVRPDHLVLGTQADNMQDMVRRGRAGRRYRNSRSDQTHCKRGHPLSGENVWTSAAGSRVCKTCSSDRQRAMRTTEHSQYPREPMPFES